MRESLSTVAADRLARRLGNCHLTLPARFTDAMKPCQQVPPDLKEFSLMKRTCARHNRGVFSPTLITAITITLFSNGSFIPLAQATLPSLQFDVEHRVTCVKVQNQTQFKVEKGERLVQACIPISTLVRQGSPARLGQLLMRIENPDRSIQVVDYQPRTTLATDIVGNIGIETKRDQSTAFDLALSGQQAGILGTTSVDLGNKQGKSVKWQHLPPLALLSASGTIARGSGVYFKLKSSNQTSLEGSRKFTLLLRVPHDWQSGVLHIDCRGQATQRNSLTQREEIVNCGHHRFVVALHATGNLLAQRHAERFIQAEMTLRRLAVVHQQQILERAYPHAGYRIAAFFQTIEPQIPNRWLEMVLFHMPRSDEPLRETPFASWSRLPAPVHAAARQYLRAKRQLQFANGIHPLERFSSTTSRAGKVD